MKGQTPLLCACAAKPIKENEKREEDKILKGDKRERRAVYNKEVLTTFLCEYHDDVNVQVSKKV